jgi:GNAT superfamily N-acetyltransferase
VNIHYQVVTNQDLPTLLVLIQAFHLTEHLAFDEALDRAVLASFVENPALGCAWLIMDGAEVMGYVIVTFGFSIEYRGRDAFIDEFYIALPYRGQGIGTQTLAFVEAYCQSLGIQALHLEADFANPDAQRLYKRTGFVPHQRVLMTKLLET